MQIPVRVDYALAALVVLAERGEATAHELAAAAGLPPTFLRAILTDLRRSGVVHSQRGPEGGYRLAQPAADVTVTDVLRALDVALTDPPVTSSADPAPAGAGRHLPELWNAAWDGFRRVLDDVSLADLAGGRIPVA